MLVVINSHHRKNQVNNFDLIQHLTESKYAKKFLIIVYKIRRWEVNLFPKMSKFLRNLENVGLLRTQNMKCIIKVKHFWKLFFFFFFNTIACLSVKYLVFKFTQMKSSCSFQVSKRPFFDIHLWPLGITWWACMWRFGVTMGSRSTQEATAEATVRSTLFQSSRRYWAAVRTRKWGRQRRPCPHNGVHCGSRRTEQVLTVDQLNWGQSAVQFPWKWK